MMIMLLSFLLLGAFASAKPLKFMNRFMNSTVGNDTGPGEVLLVSGPGYITAFEFSGSEFALVSNITVTGVPSWLATPDDNHMFAVDENSNATRQFGLDVFSQQKVLLPHQNLTANGSSGVVHLRFSRDGTRMVGSAYGSQTVDIWDTSDLSRAPKLLKQLSSAEPSNPNVSHPHQAVLDPTGNYFLINDLGTDSLVVLDSRRDAFTVAARYNVPQGCGPRHGAFFPPPSTALLYQATHYIVACEQTNTLLLHELEYSLDTIYFNQTQEISTFAPGQGAPAGAAAAELLLAMRPISQYTNNRTSTVGSLSVPTPDISADVYVSNRLTGFKTGDTISHFTLGGVHSGTKTGVQLSFVDSVSTLGQQPRSIALSRDTRHVFAANMMGDVGLAAFARDPRNGSLAATPVATVKGAMFNYNTTSGFGPQFVVEVHQC